MQKLETYTHHLVFTNDMKLFSNCGSKLYRPVKRMWILSSSYMTIVGFSSKVSIAVFLKSVMESYRKKILSSAQKVQI